MSKILDGKQTSQIIKEKIGAEVLQIKESGKREPHLVAVLVGNDGASQTYANAKMKACQKVGFRSSVLRYEANITEEFLLEKIAELNQDPEVDGFIVQMPLPTHIDTDKVIQHIAPEKDVDGFHPINIGRMAKGLPAYISATPFGILMLLEHYGIETSAKHCVVLGRSQIVGLPMSILMARKHKIGNATVTLCHSRTQNLAFHTQQADILIVALGNPNFVTADMIKEEAIVIDVGITRVDDSSKKRGYRLEGDVDFEGLKEKASYITPVPGGVGPMTIVGLLQNTLSAYKKEFYS